MKFQTTVLQTGKTTTGIPVPESALEDLGGGKRPSVQVTVGTLTYRSSIARMGEHFLISLSSDNRKLSGVGAGDEVEVTVELDTSPREVTVPDDLAKELDADKALRAHFDGLSYTNRQRHVLAVEGAKTAETRTRRLEKVLGELREGAGKG